MTLTLNDEQIKQIDTFLGEIPSKYSLQIILYINQIAQTQQKASEAAKAVPKELEAI